MSSSKQFQCRGGFWGLTTFNSYVLLPVMKGHLFEESFASIRAKNYMTQYQYGREKGAIFLFYLYQYAFDSS